jgi:hypothetical protein
VSSRPAAPTRLDVAQVLKRAGSALWADGPAILVAGVLLVLLPASLGRDVARGSGLDTLLLTLRGVGAMLFVALVSAGTVARWRGTPLPPPMFLRAGFAAAQPGVQTGLVLAAAVVTGLIVQLFARHGTVAGWLLDVLLLALGLGGASLLLPVVPAAVVERLGPRAAFARAAALTEGNRNRVLGILLLLGLALAPLWAMAAGSAGPLGFWALALVEFAGFALVAVLSAAVYVGLTPDKMGMP